MRNTKFRAWLKKEEVMVECHTIACENGTHTCYVPKKGILGRLLNRKDFFDVGAGEATLMQFTGITDKTGKEVFEGDLLRVTPGEYAPREIYEVAWNPEHLQWGVPLPIGDYVVIGNIYENPGVLHGDGLNFPAMGLQDHRM